MSTTDVEGLLWRKGILLTIDDDNAVASTTIDNTKLAIIHEVFLLDGIIYIKSQLPEVLQAQSLVDWHCATKDEAVVVRVGEQDRICCHYLLHYETFAQEFCVILLDILWMTSCLELYVLSTYKTVSLLGIGSTCRKAKGCKEKYLFHM